MGRIMKFIKKLINRSSHRVMLTDDQIIESGLSSQFHGNNKVKNMTIGKYSYVSFNSIIYNVDIGNYCSIGPNVVIGYGDHLIDQISTSPHIYINEEIWEQKHVENVLIQHFKKVKVGHDVWIGANVYIKNGVNIGIGAVIGAGSIVTKDVGNYEVVVGVPAKNLKYRFDDIIIDLLLKTEWWNLSPIELKEYKEILISPTIIGLNKIIAKKTIINK